MGNLSVRKFIRDINLPIILHLFDLYIALSELAPKIVSRAKDSKKK